MPVVPVVEITFWLCSRPSMHHGTGAAPSNASMISKEVLSTTTNVTIAAVAGTVPSFPPRRSRVWLQHGR